QAGHGLAPSTAALRKGKAPLQKRIASTFPFAAGRLHCPGMPPDTAVNTPGARHDGWNTLSRFLPYLWPKDNPALRWRIVVSSLLILASTAVQLALPYLLKWAVDAMNVTGPRLPAFVMLTVLGYSAGRFLGVGFDNLRNIV